MSTLTIESVAATLDGREYGAEVLAGEAAAWAAAGIVVAYGASDDLLEFRGAIDDEVGAYDGASVLVHCGGVLDENVWRADHGRHGLERARRRLPTVIAKWCPPDSPGLSWDVRITWDGLHDVPSARFLIVEDGEPFGRGVVFRAVGLLSVWEVVL